MAKSDQNQEREELRADKPETEGGKAAVQSSAAARPAGDGEEQRGREAGGAEAAPESIPTAERFGSGVVGGVSHIATDLVRGVGDVGEEVVIVVRDTANTAIAGVGSIGQTAIHTLADLVAGVVDGVREIGGATRRQGTTATERRFEGRPH